MTRYKVTIVCIAFLSLLLTACDEPIEPQLRVGIHIWPGYDLSIVAHRLGYFNDSNLQLIETPSATESIRAFQNKTVDSAFLTIDEAIRLSEHGHDPVIVMVTDFSNGADAILARAGISDLSDLKGKKVGVEPNALGAYVLARALDKVNLTPADVTTVSMPIVETEAAFQKNRIDAVVTFEPHLTRIQNMGGIKLFDSTEIPGEIIDVLVVRRSVLKNSPKALQSLIDSHFRVLEQLSNGSEKIISAIADRENVSADELQTLLSGLTLLGREENIALLSKTDTRLPKTISRLAEVMKAHKMLPASFTEHEFRDNRFVARTSASE